MNKFSRLEGKFAITLLLTVVAEETETGYSAHCEDMPQCTATGETLEEIETEMEKLVPVHLLKLLGDQGVELVEADKWREQHDRK